MKKVWCECGEVTGVACAWEGPIEDTVVVEWMPEHLRASHTAARNKGRYPYNGSICVRVEGTCADRILEDDEDWATICD